jgi:hypothetical protein
LTHSKPSSATGLYTAPSRRSRVRLTRAPSAKPSMWNSWYSPGETVRFSPRKLSSIHVPKLRCAPAVEPRMRAFTVHVLL